MGAMGEEDVDLPMEGARSDGGYLEQLSESMDNFLIGCGLLVLTIGLMFMVEHAVVKFATISRRAQMACRFVRDNMVIDPDFEGRVVLVKGLSRLHGAPMANSDTQTGFKADSSKGNVIRLNRVAQMYQWVEHEHKRGSDGSKRQRRGSVAHHSRDVSPNRRSDRDDVYYTYSLEWSEMDHDSSRFHSLENLSGNSYNGDTTVQYRDMTHTTHKNPKRSPDITSMSTDASASIGAYTLTERQVSMMINYENCVLNATDFVDAPNRPSVEYDDDRNAAYCYLTYKPTHASNLCSLKNPEVGMVRVRYEVIYEGGHVTTVGVQRGSSFRPFTQEDSSKYDKGCSCLSSGVDGGSSGIGGGAYESLVDEEDPYGNDEPRGNLQDVASGAGCCFPLNIVMGIIQKCVAVVVGDDVLLLEERWVSVKDMFVHANSGANLRVTILRVISMMLMWTAITMIFDPISTILGFIPLIGGMAQGLFGVLTGILALLLGVTIIATAWVGFHPEVLFVLLVGCGVVCVMYGSTDGWVTAGYVLSALSLYPAGVFCQNLVNERAFAAGQAALDQQHASATANRVPVATPITGSGGEKSGLVRV